MRGNSMLIVVVLAAFATAVSAQCTVCAAGQAGMLRPDFVPSPGNGCGVGSTADLVPDLRFGSCCTAHDLCYQTCNPKETCDRQFLACMRDVCNRETIVGEFICNQLADCYAAGVNNDIACDYWKNLQDKQCTCTANATAAPVDTANLPQLPSGSLSDCLNPIETSLGENAAPIGVVGVLLALVVFMR